MKSRYITIIIGLLTLSILVGSCKKVNETDDKNKIDIKGSMSNGDMRSPNIKPSALMKMHRGDTLWATSR